MTFYQRDTPARDGSGGRSSLGNLGNRGSIDERAAVSFVEAEDTNVAVDALEAVRPRVVEGWLTKRGGGTTPFVGQQSWKERWFTLDLTHNVLRYFTAPPHEAAHKLKGALVLTGAEVKCPLPDGVFGEFEVTPAPNSGFGGWAARHGAVADAREPRRG